MYDKDCVKAFMEQQLKLFPEEVVTDEEEALEFLEDCMAVVCKDIKEVRAYFKEEGADIAEMSDQDLIESAEVFKLPKGRYLIVEA